MVQPVKIEIPPLSKMILPVVFIIDASGEMSGHRIAAVNFAMEQTIDKIRLFNEENPCVEIKIAILDFSTRAMWHTDGLVEPSKCIFDRLDANGQTNMGEAFRELHSKRFCQRGVHYEM